MVPSQESDLVWVTSLQSEQQGERLQAVVASVHKVTLTIKKAFPASEHDCSPVGKPYHEDIRCFRNLTTSLEQLLEVVEL